eukprot:scaffold100227_cov93-Phaeocystis_antarctica.AAC.2
MSAGTRRAVLAPLAARNASSASRREAARCAGDVAACAACWIAAEGPHMPSSPVRVRGEDEV